MYRQNLKPTSLGPTYELGKWNPIHGDIKSSADGQLQASAMLGSDGRIKVSVLFKFEREKYDLFQTEILRENHPAEYDEWTAELERLKKIKKMSTVEAERLILLQDLVDTEVVRAEREETKKLIAAMIDGMEVSSFDYMLF